MSGRLTVRPATAGDAARVAELHLGARRTAMPWLARAGTPMRRSTPGCAPCSSPPGRSRSRSWTGGCVGFVAAGDGWLEHLYVDPAAQGRGAGSLLFAHVQAALPAGSTCGCSSATPLRSAFYASRGCAVVERTDGTANEEREPDVRLRWQPQT